HRQEEGIDYDEVVAHVAKIEAIRIFLSFGYYMGFIVYQIDVKSAFMYGTIDEEVYVSQPSGFVDLKFPNKLEDTYASPSEGIFTNSSYDDEGVVTDFNNLETTMNVSPTPTIRIHTIRPKTQILRDPIHKDLLAFASYMGFIVYQMDVKSAFLSGIINEEVYLSQPPGFVYPKFPNKVYKVVKALYGLHQAPRACMKTASTPIETQKLLVKDEEAADLDVSEGKSASTPIDTEKPLPKDPDGKDVDAHTYRSIIGSLMYLTSSKLDIMFAVCACEIHNRRLSISWQKQCKKQTIVAPSTIESEYVTDAYCCGQVLWIQNQLLDYGFNIMNTKIYIDNEITISTLVKGRLLEYQFDEKDRIGVTAGDLKLLLSGILLL
nr:hypothetical protein [Tanacetum cinerariifolium]